MAKSTRNSSKTSESVQTLSMLIKIETFIEKIVLEITKARYLVGDLIYKEKEFHAE